MASPAIIRVYQEKFQLGPRRCQRQYFTVCQVHFALDIELDVTKVAERHAWTQVFQAK